MQVRIIFVSASTSAKAARAEKRVASAEEMARAFAALSLQDRLILKLAGIVGMKPGEIFGLNWEKTARSAVEIRQRVYRREIDSPKSSKSIRKAALSEALLAEVAEWRTFCANTGPTRGYSRRRRGKRQFVQTVSGGGLDQSSKP